MERKRVDGAKKGEKRVDGKKNALTPPRFYLTIKLLFKKIFENDSKGILE